MGAFKNFVSLLTISCCDMSALISRLQDGNLPRSERWAVALHLLYCRACRRLSRQLRIVHDVASRSACDDACPSQDAPTLSPDARQRLKRALRE